MTAPAKINYRFYKGSTVKEVLRWESTVKVYKPITGITKSAPVVLTVPNNEVPVDWRVKVTSVLGMLDINSTETYNRATAVTTNTITINDINSLNFKDYVSGGVIEYNKPIDLTNYTASMTIKADVNDITNIHLATTANGGIIINNTTKTIIISIPASVTDTFNFVTAYYLLEIIDSAGSVIPFSAGTITLIIG
jgi:hypothetical protein